MELIGKAYVSVFKFYNNKTKKMDFKKRPLLIVGKADATDYVVLPISRVTNKNNLNLDYDIPIEPEEFPLMNLKQISYVRTNKSSTVNCCELVKEIIDFRENYPDKYLDIMIKMEEFQKNIIDNAI